VTAETLPSISEREASGEIADLYADIRETLALPVVNLIWRHFATLDGGLAWAWCTLRPLYACGAVHGAAGRLLQGLTLPVLPPVPDAVLAGAGVAPGERPLLLAILDSYNRGNALNICALASLAAEPQDVPVPRPYRAPPQESPVPKEDRVPPQESPAPQAHRAPTRGAVLPRPDRALPPVPDLDELAPPVRDLVWRLNALGQPAGDRTLATLYKHLAPWPGALSVAWALLAPPAMDGRLEAAIGAAVAGARAEAGLLAPLRAICPEPAAAAAVRAAAEHFVVNVIGRMVPVAQMLRRALG